MCACFVYVCVFLMLFCWGAVRLFRCFVFVSLLYVGKCVNVYGFVVVMLFVLDCLLFVAFVCVVVFRALNV